MVQQGCVVVPGPQGQAEGVGRADMRYTDRGVNGRSLGSTFSGSCSPYCQYKNSQLLKLFCSFL